MKAGPCKDVPIRVHDAANYAEVFVARRRVELRRRPKPHVAVGLDDDAVDRLNDGGLRGGQDDSTVLHGDPRSAAGGIDDVISSRGVGEVVVPKVNAVSEVNK